MKCSDCQHYQDKWGTEGECRINPPVIGTHPDLKHPNIGLFPIVCNDDWCSKFTLPIGTWTKVPVGSL